MSLNAVVYKNADRVRIDLGRLDLEVDGESGEIFLPQDIESIIDRHRLVAIELWLGNISDIAYLRTIIEKLLDGGDSVILNKVIYSGSHSGDTISISEFGKLGAEIVRLEPFEDEAVRKFRQNMKKLLEAGEEENNPILFV